MMAISRKYQRSIINRDLIGYSGTEGAFSHIAAERVFLDHRKKSYASFEDVFHAVTEREVAYGVIPFENSYTGEVGEVLDLLMRYDAVSYTHLKTVEIWPLSESSETSMIAKALFRK